MKKINNRQKKNVEARGKNQKAPAVIFYNSGYKKKTGRVTYPFKTGKNP